MEIISNDLYFFERIKICKYMQSHFECFRLKIENKKLYLLKNIKRNPFFKLFDGYLKFYKYMHKIII